MKRPRLTKRITGDLSVVFADLLEGKRPDPEQLTRPGGFLQRMLAWYIQRDTERGLLLEQLEMPLAPEPEGGTVLTDVDRQQNHPQGE